MFASDWLELVSVLVVVLAVYLAATVILHKRNEVAATAWVGLLILSPLFGSIAYLLFGINRIRRRAERVRGADSALTTLSRETIMQSAGTRADAAALEPMDGPPVPDRLLRLTDALTLFPMTAGNAIEVYRNGDEAYPAMISAIDNAERSVALLSYIFRDDAAGGMFVDALARAQARGVEVRVMIDGVGDLYSWTSIIDRMREAGLPHARYQYSLWPWRMPYLNLRNHRKILVVDGETGFTGGMNIAHHNLLAEAPDHPVRDLHFRLRGPVVGHLAAVFADDWQFETREVLDGPAWFPELTHAGGLFARGIPSGPHEPNERMRWVLLAAIGEARETLRIATPYFLPDETLVTALRLAALRGVTVDIIMPTRSNLRAVDWARMARLDELIADGVRVWFGPSPFNHAKVTLVDETWALVGSTNWDPRSLRLNFEFTVECCDRALAARLAAFFDAEKAEATGVTVAMVENRSLPVKLRDGTARLFAPYL